MVQACREPVTPVHCQRHHTTYAPRELLTQLHQQQIKWSNQFITDFRLNMRWIIRRVCVSLRVGLSRFWLRTAGFMSDRKKTVSQSVRSCRCVSALWLRLQRGLGLLYRAPLASSKWPDAFETNVNILNAAQSLLTTRVTRPCRATSRTSNTVQMWERSGKQFKT